MNGDESGQIGKFVCVHHVWTGKRRRAVLVGRPLEPGGTKAPAIDLSTGEEEMRSDRSNGRAATG